MEATNNVGIYTTVGEREYRAYDSLELSNIGIYNEVNEVPVKESKALKVLREDYVNKRTFFGVVTVLTLLLLITLTVLIYVKVTSKQVTDCLSILEDVPSAEDGVYEIPLLDNKWTPVYCDMTLDGGGWTVIQNRFDGSLDFYRNFSEYENGFGDTSGEFWLGLKNIQMLATKGPTELRLQMTRNNSEEGFEVFQDFKLVDGNDYRLNINITSGIRYPSEIFPNTSFAYNNGMAFSTYDKDMDRWPEGSCSRVRHGAWWYNYCSFSNLNGRYCEPGTFCKNRKSGHNHRFGKAEALLKSRMLLRRVRK